MNKKLLGSFCLSVFMLSRCAVLDAVGAETQFVVVIPSYKNIQWCKRNIESIMMQERTYTSWRAIYIDDKSPDGTGAAVAAYVHERGFDNKITVIQNEVRVGALANIYNAVHSCADHEVVCTVDGDDWLIRDDVFCILNNLYANQNVWLVYGQYREYPSGNLGCCQAISRWVIDSNSFRTAGWVTSHLRTFYAGLFKKIKKDDLMWNGNFLSVVWDLAFMYPMLEMAGERIKFNPEVVYEYNKENPINDAKKEPDLIRKLTYLMQAMPHYQRLNNLFE